MTFNSWEFLLFYPTVAVLYFVLPKRSKHILLLIASYFFYMCYQAELVFLILATTVISYFSARIMERTEKVIVRRLLLTLTLLTSLGVLFFYKYFNFLSGSVGTLLSAFGLNVTAPTLNLILPVGISFYTFQTLSYVIDVYRRDIRCEPGFIYYALFVVFFPQLVAGPIERPSNLLPQLKEPKGFKYESFVRGAKIMLLGFFKKVCVADMLAPFVNSVYNNPTEASALTVIIATVMFAVQIYCDFSGYTDIAIGCAEIMGIRLMQNFNHPYLATSIKDFWSRWHISLSGWFRDYLYISLGGNRCSRVRYLFNLFVVFLVSGLWHGASWTFVIWGALHGIYRIIGALIEKPKRKLYDILGVKPDGALSVFVNRLITFTLVAFAWIFFRANSISDAFLLVGKLFNSSYSLTAALTSMDIGIVEALTVIAAFVILLIIDKMVVYGKSDDGSAVLTENGSFILYIWLIALGFLLLLSKDTVSTFIYFQF